MQTEDEQVFLARQQQAIQQGQTPTSRGESPMRSQNPSKSTPRTPVCQLYHILTATNITSNIALLSYVQIDAKLNASGASGEGVLANFFNSLLNKKTGSPGSPASLGSPGSGQTGSPRSTLNGTPPDSLQDKMAVRNDAAAELERLTRNASAAKKEMDFSQSDC